LTRIERALKHLGALRKRVAVWLDQQRREPLAQRFIVCVARRLDQRPSGRRSD
jgi:hypothetical protein